jgi:hypothetical protein
MIDLPVKLNPMTKGPNIEKYACPNCNKDVQFLINRDTGTWYVIGGYGVGTLGHLEI